MSQTPALRFTPDDIYNFVSGITPKSRPFLKKVFNNYMQAMIYGSSFSYIFSWRSLEPFGQSNQDFRSYDDRALRVAGVAGSTTTGLQDLTDHIAISRGSRNLKFYQYLASVYFNLYTVGLVDSQANPIGPTRTDADPLGNIYATDSSSPITYPGPVVTYVSQWDNFLSWVAVNMTLSVGTSGLTAVYSGAGSYAYVILPVLSGKTIQLTLTKTSASPWSGSGSFRVGTAGAQNLFSASNPAFITAFNNAATGIAVTYTLTVPTDANAYTQLRLDLGTSQTFIVNKVQVWDGTAFPVTPPFQQVSTDASGVIALAFYFDYYIPYAAFQDSVYSVTTSLNIAYPQTITPGSYKIYDAANTTLLAQDDGAGNIVQVSGSGVTGTVVYNTAPAATILYTGTLGVTPRFTPSGYVFADATNNLLASFSPRLKEFLLNLAIVKHARIFPFVYPRLNITYQQILADNISFTMNLNPLASALVTTDQSLPSDPSPTTDSIYNYSTDNTSVNSGNIAQYNMIQEYQGTYSFTTPISGGTGGFALVNVTNEIITSVSLVSPGTGYPSTGTSAVAGGTGGIIFFNASSGILSGVAVQAGGTGYISPTPISVQVSPVQLTGLTYYWDIPVALGYIRFAVTSTVGGGSVAFDFTINAAFITKTVSFNSLQYIRLSITLAS